MDDQNVKNVLIAVHQAITSIVYSVSENLDAIKSLKVQLDELTPNHPNEHYLFVMNLAVKTLIIHGFLRQAESAQMFTKSMVVILNENQNFYKRRTASSIL
jgi:hypothetical protein